MRGIKDRQMILLDSPKRRCLCSGTELWPRRSSASDLHSDWCPETQSQTNPTKGFYGELLERKDSGRITRSPISVWSPKGSRSMSGWREQASITALYLQKQRHYRDIHWVKKQDKWTKIWAFGWIVLTKTARAPWRLYRCLLNGLPKVMFSSNVALSSQDFWAA